MVGVDLGEKPEKAKKFRQDHQLTYPILVDTDLTSSPKFKRGYAIPYNVVADSGMVVRYSAFGFDPKGITKTVAEQLSKSALRKSPAPVAANPR